MPVDFSNLDFHKFVDQKLSEKQFRITLLNWEFMENRLKEIMDFVNAIRTEYSGMYGWRAEEKDYFMNGLVDKWRYSFAILDSAGRISLVNLSSLYGQSVHMHCTYTAPALRGLGLGKLHMLKLSQTTIDNGLNLMEGFWPKLNNGSVILHLQMGWKIDLVDQAKQCVKLVGNALTVREKTYGLINK